MSYSVLVIPEDATNDHYILKPVISAMLASCGKPTARVRVLTDPAAQGVEQVLSADFLRRVVDRYPMVDLFLLCVDRDAKDGRDASVAHHEREMVQHLNGTTSFVGTSAHQELEVWCLAGMADLPREWSWADVRAERDPKERYFLPYARGRGLLDAPGDGREALGREAALRYKAIASRCPEVQALARNVMGTW